MTIYRIIGDDGPDDVTLMLLDDRMRLVSEVFLGAGITESEALADPLLWQPAPSECYAPNPTEAACRLMAYLATEGGASVVTDVEEIR